MNFGAVFCNANALQKTTSNKPQETQTQIVSVLMYKAIKAVKNHKKNMKKKKICNGLSKHIEKS